MDGIVYQWQFHGGISRLYSEILPRMCDLDDSLRIILLTEGTLMNFFYQLLMAILYIFMKILAFYVLKTNNL